MKAVRKCTVVAGWGTNFPFGTLDEALEDMLLRHDERTKAGLSSELHDGCYLVVMYDDAHSKGSSTLSWHDAIRTGQRLGILDGAGMLRFKTGSRAKSAEDGKGDVVGAIEDIARELGLLGQE